MTPASRHAEVYRAVSALPAHAVAALVAHVLADESLSADQIRQHLRTGIRRLQESAEAVVRTTHLNCNGGTRSARCTCGSRDMADAMAASRVEV